MAARSQLRESPFAESGQLNPVRAEAVVPVQSSEAAAVAPAPSSGAAGKLLAPAQCPICLEELADGGVSTALPGCSHAFHGSCIREWFHRAPAPTCPSCRRDMTRQRAYMEALAAIESHERRGSSQEAAAAAAAAPGVRRLHRSPRVGDLALRRVRLCGAMENGRYWWRQATPGVQFCPVVLTPRDDAPLFQFDQAV